MTWDKTPWFIGNGAEHSPELARLVLYASTGGAEGIAGPGDLKVLQQSSPAGSVRVMPGAALLLNRSSGGAQQTYGGRNPTEDSVPINPTGSSGGRSDLVVARVEDPQYSPWQQPADPTAAQYIFTRVIENVPAGTTSAAALNLGYPAIALARIDIPSNTGAISQAMIKDVRRLAQVRSEREVFTMFPTAKQVLTQSFDNTFHFGTIAVPPWATHAHLRGDVGGLLLLQATSDSEWRANIGGILTQSVAITSEQNRRMNAFTAGTVAIPAHLRGGTSSITLQGRKRISAGEWSVDTYSVGTFDIQFVERAE